MADSARVSAVDDDPIVVTQQSVARKLREGMLDVLGDYLTAMTGVFSYGGRCPSQNVYLV